MAGAYIVQLTHTTLMAAHDTAKLAPPALYDTTLLASTSRWFICAVTGDQAPPRPGPHSRPVPPGAGMTRCVMFRDGNQARCSQLPPPPVLRHYMYFLARDRAVPRHRGLI
jgi:hypothetical protein